MVFEPGFTISTMPVPLARRHALVVIPAQASNRNWRPISYSNAALHVLILSRAYGPVSVHTSDALCACKISSSCDLQIGISLSVPLGFGPLKRLRGRFNPVSHAYQSPSQGRFKPAGPKKVPFPSQESPRFVRAQTRWPNIAPSLFRLFLRLILSAALIYKRRAVSSLGCHHRSSSIPLPSSPSHYFHLLSDATVWTHAIAIHS